ncbi:MAG: CUAEP/CCAEP-tail radical SAM protein, partial [Anaeromyxobacteraceae bacterium]
MRDPGEILLVSTYELGHQPAGITWPLAFLERAGFAPAALDLAVEPFDEARVRAARLVVFSVPMHTALKLALRAAERVRALNPAAL